MQLCALARKCTRQTQGNHLNKMNGEKKNVVFVIKILHKFYLNHVHKQSKARQGKARQGNEVFVTFYFAIIVRIVSMYFMQK